MFFTLRLSQSQKITFVMVAPSGGEVAGLADTFVLEISKNGAPFIASTGAKTEIGNGWYTYTLSAAETDTIGPLSIRVNGGGCQQQNLEYVIHERTINAVEFQYTLTNDVTLAPIESAEIWVTIDLAGNNVVWSGFTDATGIARDDNGNLPRLDAGTYYFWRTKPGFLFANPDTEIVSP